MTYPQDRSRVRALLRPETTGGASLPLPVEAPPAPTVPGGAPNVCTPGDCPDGHCGVTDCGACCSCVGRCLDVPVPVLDLTRWKDNP